MTTMKTTSGEMSENQRRLLAAIKDAVGQAHAENLKGPWQGVLFSRIADGSETWKEQCAVREINGEIEYSFTEELLVGDMTLVLRSEDSGQSIRIPVSFEAVTPKPEQKTQHAHAR